MSDRQSACPSCERAIVIDLERATVTHAEPCEAFVIYLESVFRDRTETPTPGASSFRLLGATHADRNNEADRHAGDLLGFVTSMRSSLLRGWATRQIKMAQLLLSTLEVASVENRDDDRQTFQRSAERCYAQMRARELPPPPARFRP